MALGGMGDSVAKKILVSIDVMTKGAQEKLQAFEQQTRRATTAIDKSVTGNMSNAQSQLDQFMGGMRGMGPAAKQAETRTRGLNDRIATFGKDARFASDMANQFRMDMMSVMFAGMQLMATFGGMIRSMFKFTGAADAMGAAMKSVMLPITMALQPLLLSLSETLIGLDRGEKMVVGLTVVLLALAGVVAFLGGQLIMLSGAIAGSTLTFGGFISSLVVSAASMNLLSMSTASAAISLFSFEIAVATLIGSLFTLAAGLIAGIAVVEFFGKKVGAIVGVLAAIGAAIAIYFTAPLWIIVGLIAIVIGVIVALKDDIIKLVQDGAKWLGKLAKKAGEAFNKLIQGAKDLWNGVKKWFGKLPTWLKKFGATMIDLLLGPFDEIFMALIGNSIIPDLVRGIIKWLKKLPKKIIALGGRIFKAAKKLGKKIVSGIIDFVSKLPNKVWNFITDTVQKLKNALTKVGSAATDIGSKIINSIAEGMKNAPDAIMDAIKNIAPDWVVNAMSSAGSAISGGIDKITTGAGKVIDVNDFVMTPNGDVLKTAPDDFIFGTKTPGALAGGGGGGNEVTINIDAEVSDEVDMRELARRVGDEIDRSTGGRSNIGRGGGI